jgi:hypothetical protein
VASPALIPLGSEERRRPVAHSAAPDRSTSISPSIRQNRRNERSPAAKLCVELTDRAQDSASTAAVTSAAFSVAGSPLAAQDERSRPALRTYALAVDGVSPRSVSR